MHDLIYEKQKKYRIRLNHGYIIYFSAFEEIIIKGRLSSFLKEDSGADNVNIPLFKSMLNGIVQYLCLWNSGLDKTVSLVMGCDQLGITGAKYKVYYKVFENDNVNSSKYEIFDKAFQDFKKRIKSYN